jgi:hypothetical protein
MLKNIRHTVKYLEKEGLSVISWRYTQIPFYPEGNVNIFLILLSFEMETF